MILKTLKDLDESNGKTELWSHHAHLKQEAIKQIKNLRNAKNPTIINEEGIKNKEELKVYHIIFWIKHFFNINERDLK